MAQRWISTYPRRIVLVEVNRSDSFDGEKRSSFIFQHLGEISRRLWIYFRFSHRSNSSSLPAEAFEFLCEERNDSILVGPEGERRSERKERVTRLASCRSTIRPVANILSSRRSLPGRSKVIPNWSSQWSIINRANWSSPVDWPELVERQLSFFSHSVRINEKD